MKLNWKSQIGEMRSSKGLSVRDCSKKTKIPEGFLSSLEEGDFDSFPAEIYSKFHIQTYFNFLEIDPIDCFEAYDLYLLELNIKSVDESEDSRDANSYKNVFNFLEVKGLWPKIITFLVVIIFLFLIFITQNDSSENMTNQNLNINPVEIPEDVDEKPFPFEKESSDIELSNLIDTEVESIEDKSVKLNQIKEQLINIEVDGESWIVVKDKNEKNLLYELMQTGNYEIKGFSPLIFQIGHSPSVKIFIDKKEVDFTRAIKSASKYAHFRFIEGQRIESIKD
jgi:cytoskeletal protein RodZ